MTCSAGPCTVQTPPCGSWTTALFTDLLRRLGAPAPGAHNLGVLQMWCGFEGTGAGYNPLASGWVIGTCGCWNSIVPCYCTPSMGAQATHDNLLAYGQYGPIVTALRGDWTAAQWGCNPGVLAGLNFWGTGHTSPITYHFAQHLASLCTPTPQPVPVPVPVPTPTPPPPPAQQVFSVLGPLLLVAGAAGLGWWALNRDPALSRRVRSDAGDFVRRARRGEPGEFGESFGRRAARARGRGRSKLPADMEARLEQGFGTTEDWREAGWLTPSGRWIDLGRGGSDRGWSHSSLRQVLDDDPYDEGEIDDEVPMRDLENQGFVRVLPWEDAGRKSTGLTISARRPLTEAQRRALTRAGAAADSFAVEMGGGTFYRTMEAPNAVAVSQALREANAAATRSGLT